MSKFDILTKYIPIIQADSIGEWVIDKKTMERRNFRYKCHLWIIPKWYITSSKIHSSFS